MIEDNAVQGAPMGASSFRPVDQILRDLKKVDEELSKAKRHRENLIRELRQLGEAATQYAENFSGASR